MAPSAVRRGCTDASLLGAGGSPAYREPRAPGQVARDAWPALQDERLDGSVGQETR